MMEHIVYRCYNVSYGYANSVINDPFDIIHPSAKRRAKFLRLLFFNPSVKIIIQDSKYE